MPKTKKDSQSVVEILTFEADLQLDDDTPITIGFNREKYDWYKEYAPLLKYGRGITEATSQVDTESSIMMRQKAKRDGRKEINMTDLIDVRRGIAGVMASATDETLAELLTAVVLDYQDNIFEFEEVKGGGIKVIVNAPFNIYPIPDWYFKEDDDSKDTLKSMMQRAGHYVKHEPKRNRTNPIEVMCGYSAGILEGNPEFAKEFRRHLDKASVSALLGEAKIADDEREYFLRAMENVLLDTISDDDDNDDGGDPSD